MKEILRSSEVLLCLEKADFQKIASTNTLTTVRTLGAFVPPHPGGNLPHLRRTDGKDQEPITLCPDSADRGNGREAWVGKNL